MKCAVIKIVIYLIIIEICLATGDIGNQLAITDEPSAKIQSCVAKVIEHILNPSESLAFVITSHPDYIPSRLPNPVTVVDVRVPLPTHYKRYEVNYVIEAKSYALFARAFNTILSSSLWHPKESSKGKFVILIKEEALQEIFLVMWRHVLALQIVVVIYDGTSKNCPMKVITSNPQAEGNNCGRNKPTVFSNFSCDNISLEFLKPIRNYNGCPVFIQPIKDMFKFDMNSRRHRIMYNLLAGLKRALNVTPIFLFGNSTRTGREVNPNKEIHIVERRFGKFPDHDNSIILSRILLVWVGAPKPTIISSLNTIFLPFDYDLWIGVLFITILIVLLKWMIMKANGYNNNYVNLACAFTDIIGLTFGVCVNRIPNIWSLKLLLGFFLIYVIHIHTAYTSDLVNILTKQRWEGKIRNVEEVADSGLPIFMADYLVHNYFKNITDDGSLLGKISKLIEPLPIEMINALKLKKGFIVCEEDEAVFNHYKRGNKEVFRKFIDNLFLTNDITGDIKTVFLLPVGSYFTESLNAVIFHLWESGTQEADPDLNPSPYNVKFKEIVPCFDELFSNTKIPPPLSLKNLFPIFAILLICYSFCIIVFVAEIFVHKIVALLHSTRNQVVPLNV